MAQTVMVDDALGTDELGVGPDALGRVRMSPTEVSQFIRLDQCERYLRLRLHERSAGMRFMYDYGVVPQAIPPLLTQSGSRFEEEVERAVAAETTWAPSPSPLCEWCPFNGNGCDRCVRCKAWASGSTNSTCRRGSTRASIS